MSRFPAILHRTLRARRPRVVVRLRCAGIYMGDVQ